MDNHTKQTAGAIAGAALLAAGPWLGEYLYKTLAGYGFSIMITSALVSAFGIVIIVRSVNAPTLS